MHPRPDDAPRPESAPAHVPPDEGAWEDEVTAMTEDEFYRYLEEGDSGLTVGGV